jgi:hypothetical protein
MTDGAIAKVPGIDMIIMAGGCFRSRYLRNQYRQHYNGANGRRISIEFPANEAEVSISVSQGAVMVSTEKSLIQQRYVRRSFCIGVWEEVDGRSYPTAKTEIDAQGVERVYVTRFLLTKGLHPQKVESSPLRGACRMLKLSDAIVGPDGQRSWFVQETFFYSNSITRDGIWIEEKDIDLHPLPKVLGFHILESEIDGILEQGADGCEYYHVDYDVQIILDGHIMTTRFLVPKGGKWLEEEEDRHTADVLDKPGFVGRYDTTGVTQLYNTV